MYFYFIIVLEAGFFSNENEEERVWIWERGEMGEDMGETGGEEIIVKIYCVGEKSVFQ